MSGRRPSTTETAMGSVSTSATGPKGTTAGASAPDMSPAPRPAGLPPGPPDLEHVPLVAELATQGLAHEEYDSVRRQRDFRLTDEGQSLVYAAMKRNAERSLTWRASESERTA